MARRRRWWNVGVVKLPYAQRDVAHAVLGERPGERWQDIVGADTPDDDPRFPVGSNCTYRAWLSDAEAERFRAASNCRYVVEDVTVTGVLCGSQGVPGWQVLRWQDADDPALAGLTGLGVKIGLVDTATSIAMRGYCNITLAARGVFAPTAPPTNDGYPGFDHASLSGSVAAPYGGTLVEAVVVDSNNASSDAIIAQGITFAINNGAQVVNGSVSWGSTPTPACLDALNAATADDVVFYFADDNESLNTMVYPAVYSTTIPYVYSVSSYDISRNQISSFSNWSADVSGVAPGELILGVDDTPQQVFWAGTSAATPAVTRLAARLVSGGVSARDAGAALAATVVDMGQSPYQGHGRFDLRKAAQYLGLVGPPPTPVNPQAFAASRPAFNAPVLL